MAYLDDDQPRLAQPCFLDLSKLKVSTEEEVQSALFKVSDMRLRPERFKEEDLRNIVNYVSSSATDEYPFLNPIPPSMREVEMKELSQVDIDWKMLTLSRPTTKQEEEIFTRIVDLNKLTYKSIMEEEEAKNQRSNRLRTLGRNRPVEDSGDEGKEDNTDEFTYDYFMRHLLSEEQNNVNDGPQSLDDIPDTQTRRRPVKKSDANKEDANKRNAGRSDRKNNSGFQPKPPIPPAPGRGKSKRSTSKSKKAQKKNQEENGNPKSPEDDDEDEEDEIKEKTKSKHKGKSKSGKKKGKHGKKKKSEKNADSAGNQSDSA